MKKDVEIFGLKISTRGLEETVVWIFKNKGVVNCCGLNDAVMADEDGRFKKILESGDLLTADGMPLVWLMKYETGKGERVYGPDLMRKFQDLYSKTKVRQMFIGDEKNQEYFKKFGTYIVLPFKDEFEGSDYEKVIGEIKVSKVRVVWIGLGAKKQIIVADELKRRLPDRVYVTVGAAFDFLSGNKRQAPKWLRNAGLEWLFRLITEPGRLSGRYIRIGFFLLKTFCKKVERQCGIRGRAE